MCTVQSLIVCFCTFILLHHFYCYITALCQQWIKGVTYLLTYLLHP